jgi:hypothetical protein
MYGYPDERLIRTIPEGVTDYIPLRGPANAWRYSCYPTPNEHPETCVDFNGGLVQCDDLERRKANLRNVPPPSAYSECVSHLYAILSPGTMVYGGANRTMMDIEAYCSALK